MEQEEERGSAPLQQQHEEKAGLKGKEKEESTVRDEDLEWLLAEIKQRQAAEDEEARQAGPAASASSASSACKPRPRPNVLFGVSGSVAAIKTVEIATALISFANVVVIATKAALHFIDQKALRAIPGVHLFLDEQEWQSWTTLRDPVLHIELRRWADVFLIAPLSANTLAKLAAGINDNLVTCVSRAWDVKRPFLVAPAMNTLMWEHPHTQRHLSTLQRDMHAHVIPPVRKVLACKDVGMGAMASVHDIVKTVKEVTATTKKVGKQNCISEEDTLKLMLMGTCVLVITLSMVAVRYQQQK
ncbi:Flavin prenyltransferase-like [Balamuthia mandrillaris]